MRTKPYSLENCFFRAFCAHSSLSHSGAANQPCLPYFSSLLEWFLWFDSYVSFHFSRTRRLVVGRQKNHTLAAQDGCHNATLPPPAPKHRRTEVDRRFMASRESVTTRTTRGWVHLRVGPTLQKMISGATRRRGNLHRFRQYALPASRKLLGNFCFQVCRHYIKSNHWQNSTSWNRACDQYMVDSWAVIFAIHRPQIFLSQIDENELFVVFVSVPSQTTTRKWNPNPSREEESKPE